MITPRLSFTLIGLLFVGVAYAQIPHAKYEQIQALSDSICTFYDKQAKELRDDMADTVNGKPAPFFSKDAFAKFFDEYFTLVNYQRQSFPEGNSAGLVVAENNTKLNLTLSRKMNSSILSLGTSLNIKDQSGMLFSNEKPTAGTQVNIGYSFLLPGQHFSYDPNERPRNYENRMKVLDSVKTLYVVRNPINYKSLKQKYKSRIYSSDQHLIRSKL